MIANKNNNGIVCFGDPEQADTWMRAYDAYERCRLGDNLSGPDIRYKLWADKMGKEGEEEEEPM